MVEFPNKDLCLETPPSPDNHISIEGKLSYYHNPGREPLQSLTVGQLLDNAATRWPDSRAFVSKHEKKTLTFAQARDQANQLAASLLKLGLKPGDRIGALGATSTYWYITMLAAAKAGLVLAGINPAYKLEELKYTFNKVGIRAVVTDYMFKSQSYYDMLSELAPEMSKNPSAHPLKSKTLPNLEYVIVTSDETLPGAYRYKDVFSLADNQSNMIDVSSKIQPDHPYNIQYTSGTTGYPKAATLTHFGMINNGYFFAKKCGLHKKQHTICLQVPLFHVFGSVLGIICATQFNATLIVPGPAFKTEYSIKALQEERCTAIYGTPTMYFDLCSGIKDNLKNNPELQKGLEKFDVIISGGALCPPDLFRNIAQTLKCNNIQSAYGMSEMSPITFTNTDQDSFDQRTKTVGCVAEHTEVKVVDPDGKMVPFGTPGEVWFRGYSLMLGYWGDEAKTKEAITDCRWIKSGDLMILTEDGYGTVIGRIKDIIIRGGENILPGEIEELLLKHPKILQAYVYGAYDQRLGEEVCASIQTCERESLTEEEVKEFCKDQISNFKIPKHIRFVNDFPKTASGKVKRNVLTEMMNKELQNMDK